MNRPPIRVERGRPTQSELAALVAVLLTRRAPAADTADSAPPSADWQRLERCLPYSSPVSWRR